jgi:YVTN family beta-propeller protein
MKLLSNCIARIAVVLTLVLQLTAQNAANPIQIALLRWYQANTAAQISTCATPGGMAFDGSHIWVACNNADEIQEFNASDAALVRTVATSGLSPTLLLYDGANIWATNYGSNSVTEVNASTGTVTATFAVQSEPESMAFDGANVWVTNYGSGSISEVVEATGVVNNYTLAGCSAPWGVAFDGAHLWVACHTSNTVVEVNPVGGGVLTAVSLSPQQAPTFIAYDGETSQTGGPFIWVTDNSSGMVSKVSISNFSVANFSAGPTPWGVAFDGLYIWIGNGSSSTVTKLLQSTGATVGTYPTGGPAEFLGFDGGNIYVANHGGGTISKM